MATGAGATAPCQFLLPGAGGEHLLPGVTGADRRGARMWPRGPGGGSGADSRKTASPRGEGSPDRGVHPRPSPPRRAPHFNRPSSAGRFSALPSSAPVRPPHLLGSTRFGGRSSRQREAVTGGHHGHRSAVVAAATRDRLPGGSAPFREQHRRPDAGPCASPPAQGARTPGGVVKPQLRGRGLSQGRGLSREEWRGGQSCG